MNEEQLNKKIKPGSVESSYVIDSLFSDEVLDVSAYDIPEETAGQNILKANKISETAPKQSNITFPELELKKEYNQSKKKDYAYLAQKTDNAGSINGRYGRTPLEIARLKNGIAPKDSSGRVISVIPDNVIKLSDRVEQERLIKEQQSEAIGNERLRKFYSDLKAERKTEQTIRERTEIDAQLNTPEAKSIRAKGEERLKQLYRKTGFINPKDILEEKEKAAAKIAAEEKAVAEARAAKTARAEAADYVDLTDTRPQYTATEDPKSFTNYTRSKIYTADGKSKYLYTPSLSEWSKIDAGTSKVDKSKIQYVPETEALEYKAPQIKVSDNTYKPFSLDGIESPDYSKKAEQAIQDVSSERTRNDFFRRSNAYISDPNTGKIVARGKVTAPLRKTSENMSTPKSSSLKKYGAYALGALAATALVNTMFFGDKKGEQSNAQLYGQQPLY